MHKWIVMVIAALAACAQAQDVPVKDALAKGDMANRLMRYDEAMRWYRVAADQGSAEAQDDIGQLYELARGVQEDQAQAMLWFRKAGDQGYAPGEFDIGLLYANGWGPQQDYKQALAWYRKSADHGYAIAAEQVGAFYENGLGVSPDFAEARIWYIKAIDGGDMQAQLRLCGPDQRAYFKAAVKNDLGAMDAAIAKIDSHCGEVLVKAKEWREEKARGGSPRPR